MSESFKEIKVLHFYNFMISDGEHFPHEVTAISNSEVFVYLSNVLSDEQASGRAKRILSRVQEKMNQRLKAGNPFDARDYIQISQIGMTQYFTKPGDAYPEGTSFESVLKQEREILNEKRVEFVLSKIKKTASDNSELAETPLLKSLVLPPMTPGILEDVEQVMNDFPDLIEQLDSGADITAPGMIELVFALVGSIHPNDPNGWVLDYLDEYGNLKSEYIEQ